MSATRKKSSKAEASQERSTRSVFDSRGPTLKADKSFASSSRQIEYDDAFKDLYGRPGLPALLVPPYLPGRMFEIAEESDILTACIATYVVNVDGFGHEIVPVEGVDADQPQEAKAEKVALADFFKQPNDRESFGALRGKLRRDFETTGNSYLEIIRDRAGRPFMAFWMDARRVRMTAQGDPVAVTSRVSRQGELVDFQTERRFRQFAMLAGSNPENVRYFREYGDPRPMDALTGRFLKPGEQAAELASEVIHLKHGNAAYGIPRWIGTVLKVLGISKADFVNFDLFDSQGIPPMLVSVAGGRLTDESFEDLLELFRRAKGVANFHKLLVLEAEGTVQVDGKETAPRIDIKSLSEHRAEDAMFLEYSEDARRAVREQGFRLGEVFLGRGRDVNRANSFILRTAAEEQIFQPERTAFDEIMNMTLVKDLGGKLYRFRSKAPVIKSTDELISLLPKAIESGAFTVNELIHFCNEHFGTKLTPYDEEFNEWANVPIPFILGKKDDSGREFADKSDRKSRLYQALMDIDGIASRYAKQ